jgi:hypothetical protein
MRAAILSTAALVLAGCGGGGSATTGTAASCPTGNGNAWSDCQLTPAAIAIPLADEAAFRAAFAFSPGDHVVNCFTGEHVAVRAVAYPNDATVQLSTGQWVNVADLIQDGPPYSCEAQS